MGATAMSKIQNVCRKAGTYYYRRLIRLGNDKPFRLRVSLRTTDPARARVMAPALSVACETLRMNMMGNIRQDGLNAAQRAEIFRRQICEERDRLEIMHASLAMVGPSDEQSVLDALKHRLGAAELANLEGIGSGSVDDFMVAYSASLDDENKPIVLTCWSDLQADLEVETVEESAARQLAALGQNPSPLMLAMAKKVIRQAKLEAIREFRAALSAPSRTYAPVPAMGYEAAQPHHVSNPTQQPTPHLAGTSEWAGLTATQAVEKFITHHPRTGGDDGTQRKGGRRWTDKTREQFKLPALLLEQVMGGRPLAAVTHDDLVALNRCFENLHGPSFRKSEHQRKMTILEVVEETRQQVANGELDQASLGLGLSTTNRHWGFLRQLTGWFAKHHPLANLDYSAFIAVDRRNERDLTDAYTVEEGKAMFALAPWSGCKSLAKRLEPGDHVWHDSLYFVPLIAWYTGLRRGEICGLELADIACEAGIWYFRVRENETRSLKTAVSERDIPFANELCRLGLPGYIEALRKQDETLLFPELRAASGKGNLGDAFYKNRWSKIAARLPFLERGQALHSFRHTVATELKSKGVREEVRSDLAGHKVAGENGGRYAKPTELKKMQAIVNKIPIVTASLNAVSINLLPAKLREPRPARKRRA